MTPDQLKKDLAKKAKAADKADDEAKLAAKKEAKEDEAAK